jgi:hypothetical protein
MALFGTSAEDRLIAAISAHQGAIRLEHCVGSVKSIFKAALRKEPRLAAFLSGYEYTYMKQGLVQVVYDYDITITYLPDCPADINNVILDNGSWDAKSLIPKGKPKEADIVTRDPGGIQKQLSENLSDMLALYEGLHGWQTNTAGFEDITDYSVVRVRFDFLMPQGQLRSYQAKGNFAAKTIWKKILGRAKVPDFVKPFLAQSYLSQECCYDQRAYDELEGDPSGIPSDPIPHLGYGPLVENRGICGGLAWAFKALMDEARIECICVSGYLKEDTAIGHMWNMVKMDGQYYHVDPTWGIKDDGVFVGGLMQPDSIMRSTHIWDASKYPAARGTKFDYDYVEDFLADNGNDYLDDGANEGIFFPDSIYD